MFISLCGKKKYSSSRLYYMNFIHFNIISIKLCKSSGTMDGLREKIYRLKDEKNITEAKHDTAHEIQKKLESEKFTVSISINILCMYVCVSLSKSVLLGLIHTRM